MRVLHFIPVYAPAWQFGGPILSVSRLCEGLVEQGVDVRVITTNAGLPDFPKNQLAVPQDINGVKVTYYLADKQESRIRSRSLVEALPKHMAWADILHLSSIWQPLGIPVQQASHAAGVPVIQTLRGALGPYSWRRGWWKKVPYFWLKERPLLQRAASLHCTTRQEEREISWLRLKPPIQLLPNPTDFTHLHCSVQLREKWRLRMSIPLSETVFLVSGRLHHKKGLDLLLAALQCISDRPWQIIFIGKDEDGTGRTLRRAFMRSGLANRCHWLDQLPSSQLSGLYNAADHLLLPSRHENFGNVVIEALACGCGVVISDRVGVKDYISSIPGVFVSPRTQEGFTAALRKALSTSRPGSVASTAVSQFSKSCVAKEAINLYQDILSF